MHRYLLGLSNTDERIGDHANGNTLDSGTYQIREERVRQMQVEGWTKEHDDEHRNAELTAAARAYAWAGFCQAAYGADDKDFKFVPNDWPVGWAKEWWKPSPDPIRNLVKAGALIAAEIDRLQRKKKAEEKGKQTPNA